MKLIIYICCQESQAQIPERSVVTEWADAAPTVETMVSMGQYKRWTIVDVATYVCESSTVDAVYLAHVYADNDCPPRQDWDASFARPEENIHVELSGVGSPKLQLGFNVLGQSPKVGAQLMNYERTDHPTLVKPVATGWVIDSFDEFRSQNGGFYKAIYLSWCKQFAIA